MGEFLGLTRVKVWPQALWFPSAAALVIAGGLLAPLLVGRSFRAEAATCASAGISVTRVSSPILYIDTGIPTKLTGMYAGYTLTNGTGSAYDDFWVTVGGFSGPRIGLAANEDGRFHVGALPNGGSATVYFYLNATGVTAAPEAHTVSVFPSRPDLATADCSQSFTLGAEETIKANANKVTAVLSSPNPPEIGGALTMTVTGETGTMIGGVFALTPASLPTWPASSLRLTHTVITLGGGNSGTYDDRLYLNGLNSPDTSYTIVYTFLTAGTSAAPIPVAPVNYISSGGNIKHTATDTATYQALAPIPPPQNFTVIVTVTAVPAILAGAGSVSYTVTFTNSGTVPATLDDITVTLPSVPDLASYVSGSAGYNGVPISDPNLSGQTLAWIGEFSVPAGDSSVMTFDVSLPASAGAYDTSVVGHIGSTQIDSTIDPTDDEPAIGRVVVGDAADLSINQVGSPNPVDAGSEITYTISVTNAGPSTASNVRVTDTLPAGVAFTSAFPSQGVCSESSGVVTCDLGAIGSGASAAVTVTGTVGQSAASTLENAARVSSETADQDPANNEFVEVTGVSPAPTPTPTASPTPTPTASPTPTPTPTTSPSPTPTASPTPTPTASPTATPAASLTSTPTASPTATPTASPAPISREPDSAADLDLDPGAAVGARTAGSFPNSGGPPGASAGFAQLTLQLVIGAVACLGGLYLTTTRRH